MLTVQRIRAQLIVRRFIFVLLSILVFKLHNASKIVRVENAYDAYLISIAHSHYRLFPDNETLNFYGHQFEHLSTIPRSHLDQLSPADPIPSIVITSHAPTCDDYDDQTSLKCRLIQDEDDLLTNLHFMPSMCNPSVTYLSHWYSGPGTHLIIGHTCWDVHNKAYIFTNYDPDGKVGADLEVQTWTQPDSVPDKGDNADSSRSQDQDSSASHEIPGEDPRVMHVPGNESTLIVVTNTGPVNGFIRTVVTYASVNKAVESDRSNGTHSNLPVLTVINSTVVQPPEGAKQKTEKNWSPFFHEGRLHFIQSMKPELIIVKQMDPFTVEGSTQTEVVSRSTSHLLARWDYGIPRGGTPARRLGRDHYLSFFHSLHTNQYCHPTFENYYFGAIIFSSAPASMSGPPGHSRTGDSTGEHASTASFTVTAVSKVPFYHSGWYEGKWLTRKKGWAVGIEYVFFPMNFYFVDTHTGDVLQEVHTHGSCDKECLSRYNVTVSYGQQDNSAYLATINLFQLHNTLSHV